MKKPLITVIIATFNSSRTIELVLQSIHRQKIKAGTIEILLIDGGSSDNTHSIAKRYNARIIENPRTEPVYGKYLGYIHAEGKYITYLDHDEVLENINSMQDKINIFENNQAVKAVLSTGYKNPPNASFISQYINEFGDPFSFFIYRLSKDHRFFISTMKKRYKIISENNNGVIFDLTRERILPIIELCAMGSMIKADYMKKEFPETLKDPVLITHFFYLFNSRGGFLGITKHDPLVHYSSEKLKTYYRKINWRVKNNTYHVDSMGESGFIGRENFQPFTFKIRKYLFIPYVYLIIPVLINAVQLSISRKNMTYVIHMWLSIYTLSIILYHQFLRLLGKNQKLKSYDESKEVRL